MKKVVIIVLIVILLLGGAGAYAYFNYIRTPTAQNTGNSVPVTVTMENFAQVLSGNSFVRDLPDDAVISLVVGDEYYTIKKSSVTKEKVNGCDFQLSIPEKYIPMLGNLCTAVQTAKSNGELGFESSMSKTSLLWKYKSAIKYKDCFGL